MKRRNFLKYVGLGGFVAILPGVGYVATSSGDAIMGIVKNELSYLTLDEEGLKKFAKDFEAEFPDFDFSRVKILYMLSFSSVKSSSIEKIVRNYLKGTDFFRNKMDESKVVYYSGLYNPYKTPCANPFNNIYYPESV